MPNMDERIYVGTADGLHEVSSGSSDLVGRDVGALARGAGSWWAIADGREILTGTPGSKWESVATTESLRLNCIAEVGGAAFAGTAEAHLLKISDGVVGQIGAFEAAPGHDDWYTPWGGPPDVRSLTIAGDQVLANVHVGGILRTHDPESEWAQTIDIHSDVHEVLAAPEPSVVVAATAWGLAVSEDGAGSWTFESDGLHATYARAVALCEQTILLTASTGPRGGRAAVYRRPLRSGAPFEKCEQGLPEWFADNIDTSCLAASGERAAFGTSDGSVFLSDDAGSSWQLVASGLPRVRTVALG